MAKNVVVFLPNWIGDVVMATPTLRALRKQYGDDTTLHGVCRPYVRDVLAGTDWLDEEVSFDPRSADTTIRSRAVTQQLRHIKPDTVLMLTNSLRAAWMAWSAGARQRVGYVRNGRGPLLTDRLYPERMSGRRVPVSAVDYYLQLAYAVGCPLEPRRVELGVTESDERLGNLVWEALALPTNNRVVVFHTAGGWGGLRSIKAWPAEHFAQLARQIVEQLDMQVLVICGPNERDTARHIVQHADDARVKSLAEFSPSIGLSKVCVSRAACMVTTDSGPRHFAAAFGIPTVSLFGPTDPRWAINYNPHELLLVSDIDCAPCAKKTCPLGHHRCMQDMDVTSVFRAVASRMKVREHSHAA